MAEKRQAGAWAIIYCPSRQSFLFGKRSKIANNPGQWNLFGGRVSADERPRIALLRELHEESGLTPPRNRLIHLSSIAGAELPGSGNSGRLRTLNYYAVIAGYEMELMLNHEHSQYRWFKQRMIPRNVNRPTAIALQLGLLQKVVETYT